MTTADRRERIRDALRAYGQPPEQPTVRVASAATTATDCRHCGEPTAAAIRRSCAACPAEHVAVICSTCTTASTWGDHFDRLTLADRALLRETAHRVGRLRGAA